MTYVVECILSTNMQHAVGEISVGQLHTIVNRPERRAVTVADACETTTRCSVRLKHHEGQASLLGEHLGVRIYADELDGRRMDEVFSEDALRIDDGIACSKLSGTIVVGIT